MLAARLAGSGEAVAIDKLRLLGTVDDAVRLAALDAGVVGRRRPGRRRSADRVAALGARAGDQRDPPPPRQPPRQPVTVLRAGYRCVECGDAVAPDPHVWRCPECAGLLDVAPFAVGAPGHGHPERPGLWRYLPRCRWRPTRRGGPGRRWARGPRRSYPSTRPVPTSWPRSTSPCRRCRSRTGARPCCSRSPRRSGRRAGGGRQQRQRRHGGRRLRRPPRPRCRCSCPPPRRPAKLAAGRPRRRRGAVDGRPGGHGGRRPRRRGRDRRLLRQPRVPTRFQHGVKTTLWEVVEALGAGP